jgi:hypothetical protein
MRMRVGKLVVQNQKRLKINLLNKRNLLNVAANALKNAIILIIKILKKVVGMIVIVPQRLG